MVNNKCCWCGLVCGLILAFVIPFAVNRIIDGQILDQVLITSEKSSGWDTFVDSPSKASPVEIDFCTYFWNVTNPRDVAFNRSKVSKWLGMCALYLSFCVWLWVDYM